MASRTYSLVEEWRRKTNYQLTQEDQKALTACSLRRSRLQGVGLLGGLGLGLLISRNIPNRRHELISAFAVFGVSDTFQW